MKRNQINKQNGPGSGGNTAASGLGGSATSNQSSSGNKSAVKGTVAMRRSVGTFTTYTQNKRELITNEKQLASEESDQNLIKQWENELPTNLQL